MSLNESPVDVTLMARVYAKLRETLQAKSKFVRIPPTNAVEGSMDEKHFEYWILKKDFDNPWIYITIGQLYHPISHNTYAVQVVCTVPSKTWDNEKYDILKKRLDIQDPEDPNRDYMLENIIARVVSEYTYSEGVVLRDTDQKEVDKKAMNTYLNLSAAVNKLISSEDEIVTKLQRAMDEYLKMQ